MKKLLNFFKLRKEAVLLDSLLYILKTFLAVIAAYIIAYKNPILKLDIISVLFGLMLTLEPVNLTGVRNGMNQIYSTVLGAVSTAIIIYILGINIISIALSIAFTLYVCLKIDWRAVSPVAIFTSIYMTQYVQKTAFGTPSIFLTFKLRIYALLLGVIIAILFNYLFSRFYYKSMTNKRITFILNTIISNFRTTYDGIAESNNHKIKEVQTLLPNCFNNIDWVFSLFQDIKKEYHVKSRIIDDSVTNMETLSNILLFLRAITHLNYDINYLILDSHNNEFIKLDKTRILKELEWILTELKKQYNMFNKGSFEAVEKVKFLNDDELISSDEIYCRLIHDLTRIRNSIFEINNDIFKYNKSINSKG